MANYQQGTFFGWSTTLPSPKYGFSLIIKKRNQKYLEDQKGHLNDRMNEFYLSNPVKRTIFRTLACVDEFGYCVIPYRSQTKMAEGGCVFRFGYCVILV